jgi:hypothetical protein
MRVDIAESDVRYTARSRVVTEPWAGVMEERLVQMALLNDD